MYFFSVISNFVLHRGNFLQKTFGARVSALHGNSTSAGGFSSQYPPIRPGENPLLLNDALFALLKILEGPAPVVVDAVPIALLAAYGAALLLSTFLSESCRCSAIVSFRVFLCFEIFLLLFNGALHFSLLLPDPKAVQSACLEEKFRSLEHLWPFSRFSTEFCSDCLASGHTLHCLLAALMTWRLAEENSWRPLKALALFSIIGIIPIEVLLIIATRNHYSIDCLAAISLVFLSAEFFSLPRENSLARPALLENFLERAERTRENQLETLWAGDRLEDSQAFFSSFNWRLVDSSDFRRSQKRWIAEKN